MTSIAKFRVTDDHRVKVAYPGGVGLTWYGPCSDESAAFRHARERAERLREIDRQHGIKGRVYVVAVALRVSS